MATVRAAGLSESPLSVDRLLGLVSGPATGGLAVFAGVVRDHDSGAEVTALDYTAHPSAERALADCAALVAGRHDVQAVAVEHRIGHLAVGDLAVVIAVGAAHRAAALEACRDLIDTLKQQVPIWKEQHLVSGSTQWVGLPDDAPGDHSAAVGPGQP